MRKIYMTLLLIPLLFAACSKDFLKSYDERIVGTWKIIDIDRYGFNGDDNLPFDEEDLLRFSENGALTFEKAGNTFQVSWDIQRERSGDDAKKRLYVTGVDFSNQQVRTEYFNDMVFTNTNRFTAFINYNTRTYVYRFVRQ